MSLAEGNFITQETLAEVIQFLHRGATADEFSILLARAEAQAGEVHEHTRLVECVRMAMGVRNRLELQQQRERGLLAVIESAQDLSSRLDLLGLLKAIVSRARVLLGSQVAWLSVYDAELDEFKVQVTDGALSEHTDKMTARRNSGIASMIMSSRLPYTTPDYLGDRRFPHDEALDRTFRSEEIAALVGAPLIYANEVIGLLFVADRYHRSHTASEVSILCTLATHAAVAIKNAKAFELTAAALRNADMARAELEGYTRSIQAAAEAHERLTSLLAQGCVPVHALSKCCAIA